MCDIGTEEIPGNCQRCVEGLSRSCEYFGGADSEQRQILVSTLKALFLVMNLPKDTGEVHSFIGQVEYSAKFMPDVSSIANCSHAQNNFNPSPGESGFKVHTRQPPCPSLFLGKNCTLTRWGHMCTDSCDVLQSTMK